MGGRETSPGAWRRLAALAAVAVAALPFAVEVRVARPTQPLTDRWRKRPVAPRGATLLGISLRPRQIEALGLDAQSTLTTLLAYPFQVLRLGAYWQQCEPTPGAFFPDELDWQIAAAEQSGKQIILSVGAIKNFGYPEFFVPAHHRHGAFAEGTLIAPTTQPRLLEAACAFITRVIERYRDRPSIVAWQVEHESAWNTPGVWPRRFWRPSYRRSVPPTRPDRLC
jgi:hypothetical protein